MKAVSSMTGYAALSREIPGRSLSIEIKSVNGRFLDLQLRLPDDLRQLEPLLRERIGQSVQRGKVECRMAVTSSASSTTALHLNQPLLEQLQRLQQQVLQQLPQARTLSVADLLRWPGMLDDPTANSADPGNEWLRQQGLELLQQALAEFSASREREGAKLAGMLRERVDSIERRLGEIAPALPAAISAYQSRLTTKLREALGSQDEERIRQEVAVYGVKVDVTEELQRLQAHVQETRRVLEAGGAVGKRLDFLMQELNREANTLGSKMVSRELSDASLEFKLLIEQMREQVQNLE
jgi:uncharacterized protein (TIGR00255 family)